MFNLKNKLNHQKNKQIKQDMLSNMDMIEQVVNQVQRQDCGKSMSAKNLRYSHAA